MDLSYLLIRLEPKYQKLKSGYLIIKVQMLKGESENLSSTYVPEIKISQMEFLLLKCNKLNPNCQPLNDSYCLYVI